MMNIPHLLLMISTILLIHWIADFVLQSNWMATNKSSSWKALLSHTLLYSSVFVSIMIGLRGFNIEQSLIFFGITFVCHTITDAITSRITKKLWQNQQIHNFFVVIGFDQFLHAIQLIWTVFFVMR